MTLEKSPDFASPSTPGPTRRQFLGGIGAALLGGPAFIRSAHAADSIVFVGWGGSVCVGAP